MIREARLVIIAQRITCVLVASHRLPAKHACDRSGDIRDTHRRSKADLTGVVARGLYLVRRAVGWFGAKRYVSPARFVPMRHAHVVDDAVLFDVIFKIRAGAVKNVLRHRVTRKDGFQY